MRSFVVLLNFFIIVYKFASSAESEMILLIHPDLESYFFEILSNLGDPHLEFLEMTKAEKRQACMNSVQSYQFFVPKENESASKTISGLSTDVLVNNINRYYDKNIPDAIKYYNIATAVKNVVLSVNAHMCWSTPEIKWFLTHGDAEGTYITLGKDREEYYTVRGLLEPIPEVTSMYDSNNNYTLDRDFKQNMEEINASEALHWNYKKSICELTDLQRARICSAVYVAYQQHMGLQIERINVFTKRENLCLKNAQIELEPEDGRKVALNMDLIPCHVDNKSSTPMFYLADDVYSFNCVYVLHQTDTTSKAEVESQFESSDPNSPTATTFRLAVHVQNLTQLGDSF